MNKDAVKRLSDSMSKLSGMFHDVEGNLGEIEDILKVRTKTNRGASVYHTNIIQFIIIVRNTYFLGGRSERKRTL